MKISIEWAMTRECSGYRPCGWCEAEFEPRSVMVCVDPHGYEICGECAEAILRRRPERGSPVAADWPTWEEYQQALREHPDFMLTEEELERAEELGLYGDFFGTSFLG